LRQGEFVPSFILLPAIAVLGFALVACSGRTRRFESIPGEAVTFVTVPYDTYAELDPDDLAALWPTIRRFELDAATLSLRVGQDYPLQALRVIVVDSTGARIGQIAELEYTLTSDVVRLMPNGALRGMKVGESILTIQPRLAPSLEPFAPLPAWRLTIYVDPVVKE
jgi:hypothetical protein